MQGDRSTLTLIALLTLVTLYNAYRIETIEPQGPFVFNVEIIEPHELRHFRNRAELENFLEMDTTDLLDYRGDFKCLSFAEMLSHRAMESGYRLIVLQDAWTYNITVRHAYNMAYCTEEDAFYIVEPQSDAILWSWSYTRR